MKKTAERKQREHRALNRWAELAGRNMKTDLQVNDLLEEIAGSKYQEDGDDPIWETIQSLTDDELADFMDGCDNIDELDTGKTEEGRMEKYNEIEKALGECFDINLLDSLKEEWRAFYNNPMKYAGTTIIDMVNDWIDSQPVAFR